MVKIIHVDGTVHYLTKSNVKSIFHNPSNKLVIVKFMDKDVQVFNNVTEVNV